MTQEKLQEILGLPIADLVKELQTSSYIIPKWSDLEKQYDPMKHSILDTTKYPAKLNDFGIDDLKRTPLALQKLAVNRMAQAMFATPVQRNYDYNRDDENELIAITLIENIYRTRNNIDSSNIERCKAWGATCQFATVWSVVEKPVVVGIEQSKYKLVHSNYSEMDGYKLYPIKDTVGDLLIFSIGYSDSTNTEWLLCYLNLPKPELRVFSKVSEWTLIAELSKTLEIFPVVYLNLQEPVWGGNSGTLLIEQLEEMETYQGMYIKKNALPVFTLDYGDKTGLSQSIAPEQSNDARKIILLGKGGVMSDVTWKGADEAVNSRYQRIRNSYFEQIQVPDTSFANMVTHSLSADNREMVFADAKAKARDLGGEWERLFFEELEIIKAFLKIMFPKYSTAFDLISIRSTIKPYSIRTRKENAEYISIGGNAMSMETQVRILGEVDDVNQEIEIIQQENATTDNINM